MNTFGRLFRVSIAGESHGPAVSVVLDGVPAGLPLKEADFSSDLQRRRGGVIKGTTTRAEADVPVFRSGIYQGHTTGSPLTIEFPNADIRSSSYAEVRQIPRPGHADFVAEQRFSGFQDPRGGGHFSGRLTVAVVAAGIVAKKLLPMSISAQLAEVAGSAEHQEAVAQAQRSGDSVGGIVECRVTKIPVGLGEPFFDSVESLLAHAIFAIPAVKGIEFGSGFAAATMRGSEHNDYLVDPQGTTATNHAGGVNGGLTNGNEIYFRTAIKPTASITQQQHTIDLATGQLTELRVQGRHDACIALRVPVVVEAMTAIVLADLYQIAGLLPRVWS
ncbi:MAG: chorismate synthase [Propionibacteriaceae bacterium]